MIITKRAISRRTLLRGMGVSLALPLLDGMIPAFAGVNAAVTTRPRRLSVIYVPNGMMMPSWTPATEGAGFVFPRTVKSLEPLRDYVTLVSGLKGVKGNGAHAGAATRFMTDVNNKLSENSEIEAGISMDQYAAMVLGKDTQMSSLELAIEGRDFAASCDVGLSCAYTNTISWRSPTTPLPMDNDPRSVFERLFGDSAPLMEPPAPRNAARIAASSIRLRRRPPASAGGWAARIVASSISIWTRSAMSSAGSRPRRARARASYRPLSSPPPRLRNIATTRG